MLHRAGLLRKPRCQTQVTLSTGWYISRHVCLPSDLEFQMHSTHRAFWAGTHLPAQWASWDHGGEEKSEIPSLGTLWKIFHLDWYLAVFTFYNSIHYVRGFKRFYQGLISTQYQLPARSCVVHVLWRICHLEFTDSSVYNITVYLSLWLNTTCLFFPHIPPVESDLWCQLDMILPVRYAWVIMCKFLRIQRATWYTFAKFYHGSYFIMKCCRQDGVLFYSTWETVKCGRVLILWHNLLDEVIECLFFMLKGVVPLMMMSAEKCCIHTWLQRSCVTNVLIVYTAKQRNTLHFQVKMNAVPQSSSPCRGRNTSTATQMQ